jgi:hypothetical protein
VSHPEACRAEARSDVTGVSIDQLSRVGS